MKKLIYPYNSEFIKIFNKEKSRISKRIKNVQIHHIGSTSIPKLGGKGIIDMMIGIKTWEELNPIIKKFKSMGFKYVHPREKGRVFLSHIGETKLGGVHIHIVITDQKQYKNLLAFRNYLSKNKKESERFFKLKQKWEKQVKGDRIKYGKLKEKYVKQILRKVYSPR